MSEIRRVVLYKHGVAYFEQEAQVQEDALLELEFPAGEMNDILKSLTVVDLDGGQIRNIAYEASRDIAQARSELALDLPVEDVLREAVKTLRGNQVHLHLKQNSNNPVKGRLLGLQSQERKDANAETHIDYYIALLLSDGSLVYHILNDVQRFEFPDEAVARDFNRMLDLGHYRKKKELKKLKIYTEGSGPRRLRLGYLAEAPVWKSSYRLLIEEDGVTLQGWAMIDNEGEQDWQNIRLSLVSGLPISFIHDLYHPRYQRRPEIKVKGGVQYGAPQLESGSPPPAPPSAAPMAGGMAPRGAGGPPGRAKMKVAREEVAESTIDQYNGPTVEDIEAEMDLMGLDSGALQASMGQSADVAAAASDQADLYTFEIQTPISVGAGQSALVPLVSEKIEGERVAIYAPDVRKENPLTAIYLKNSTALSFESGPATVYDNTGYLGEGMLDSLRAEQKQILPFAVDTTYKIWRDHKSKRLPVYRIVIRSGVMYLHRYTERTTTYRIDASRAQSDTVLFLEHRFASGYKLVEPQDFAEETSEIYRFKMDVRSKDNHEFKVVERDSHAEHVHIDSITIDDLHYYISSTYLNEQSRTIIERIVELKTKLANQQHRLAQLQSETQASMQQQDRLRKNIKALGSSMEEAELRKRYIANLSQDEDRMQKREQEIEQVRLTSDELKQKVQLEIEKLSQDLQT